MINIFTTYYQENNEIRRMELDLCLALNKSFDHIFILTDEDFSKLKNDKNTVINLGKRPMFSDFLKMMNNYPNDINILCNTDIYFNRNNIEQYCLNMPEEHCYALSRWDTDSFGNKTLFNRADSQDAWIFYGSPRKISADFCLGVPGCDNRFAYELSQAGYTVLNRSKSIQAFHIHSSNIRNYIKPDGSITDRVPAPYLLLPPMS